LIDLIDRSIDIIHSFIHSLVVGWA